MPAIIITEFMDEAAVARLAARHDTLYDPRLVDDMPRLLALLPEARALIVRNRTQVRGAVLAAGARLEIVGRLGVGLDNIDTDACAARRLPVVPATGANDLSVAEWVITSALLLLRGAYHATDAVIAGEWPRNRLMGRELSGRVMGLVGFGAIAREVARRARALGMDVMAHDPFVKDGDPAWALARPHGLEPLLREADVVSLHVPLTDGTRHLIDDLRLRRMRKDAVLLNAARGGIVDEAALALALKDGRLAGAALDVFEEEPLTAARAAIFRDCPNLILTPHIAGVTAESNIRVSTLIADKVLAALDGGH
ncbi:hydroxyacid dehydrogenase [Rhabdaerophilum calidifontis]|uniref:hydroxyacid dehydrogenase n=1 Tax=Rhabdaerophilum calidifontis TaxID=2604328 RepID=UPI001238710F|nr:hydroxyacid dehydrogenase [Rhabdaerophilum calidifontis]